MSPSIGTTGAEYWRDVRGAQLLGDKEQLVPILKAGLPSRTGTDRRYFTLRDFQRSRRFHAQLYLHAPASARSDGSELRAACT